MIELHQIDLTKDQLRKIPDAERRLLVLAAHATNEINTLAKLFHFAVSSSSDAGLKGQAEITQAQVLARVLVGKIHEFWKMLQACFFKTRLAREYGPLMDEESSAALNELKAYFGSENLVTLVRNKFAFHYSADQIDAGYEALVDGDPLQIYLAKHNANTLLAFADTIAGRSMLEAIRPGEPEGAFDSLVMDTTKLVGTIGEVASGLVVVCLRRHLGDNLYDLGARVISIDGVPDSQVVKIPYFIEIHTPNDEDA